MSNRRSLGRGFGRSASALARRSLRRATRPVVESLENRQMLAAGTIDRTDTFPLTAPTDSRPTAVLRLADGRVLVAAKPFGSDDVLLTRLTAGGAPDPDFGAGGHLVVNLGPDASISALAVDGDGHVLAAGRVKTGPAAGPLSDDMFVARFDATSATGWRLDPAFGVGGVRTFPLAGDQAANTITLKPDGSAIAIGGTQTIAGVPGAFVVAQATTNGTPLSTFSGDGIAVTEIGTRASVHALLFDGDALYAGGFSNPTATGRQAFTVAQYTGGPTGGQLDPSFDADGVAINDAFTTDSAVLGLAIENGNVLAIGRTGSINGGAALARFSTLDGAPVGFGPGGAAPFVVQAGPFGFTALAGARETTPGGGIVVAGQVQTADGARLGTIRLKADGDTYTFDASYAGNTGAAVTALNDVQGDKPAFVSANGGAAFALGDDTLGPRRYAVAGSIAPGGVVAFGMADATAHLPAGGRANAVVAQSADGSLLIGGEVSVPAANGNRARYATLVRQRPDGSLDLSFGAGGVVDVNFGTRAESVQSVAVDPQGRILVAGRTAAAGAAIARYLADGTPDATFASGGVLSVGPATIEIEGAVVRIATVGDSGGFVLGGTAVNPVTTETDFFVARYDAAGALVPTFANGGIAVTSFGEFSADAARALLVTPDGIYLGGATDRGALPPANGHAPFDFALVKYDHDGHELFATANDFRGGDDGINALAYAGGRVYAAGAHGVDPSGSDDTLFLGEGIAVAQYLPSGQINADLANGLTVATLLPPFGTRSTLDGANSLAVDADGNFVVGTTVAVGANLAMGVVRLTPQGEIDAGYATGGLAVIGAGDFTSGVAGNTSAGAIAVLPDGRAIVVGATDTAATGRRDLAVAMLSAGGETNLPPVPGPIVGPSGGRQGIALAFGGSFTDPGDDAAHAELWTVTHPATGGAVIATGSGPTFAWTPADAGTFVVTYTVTDAGGLSAFVTRQVVVTPAVTAVVADGLLTIRGTAAGESITLARNAAGDYVLTAAAGEPARTFPAAGLTGIRIDAGDGDDLVTVGHGVALPVELHGGAGDDSLTGGSGDDLLFGESGNDVLAALNGDDVAVGGSGDDIVFGGAGRDVLVGGAGADQVAGENGDDLLVAGGTSHDADPAALAAVRAAWTTGADYAARVSSLQAGLLRAANLLDDGGAADLLSGNNGKDWFVADLDGDDSLFGAARSETVTDPA